MKILPLSILIVGVVALPLLVALFHRWIVQTFGAWALAVLLPLAFLPFFAAAPFFFLQWPTLRTASAAIWAVLAFGPLMLVRVYQRSIREHSGFASLFGLFGLSLVVGVGLLGVMAYADGLASTGEWVVRRRLWFGV
jgi:hypothetical protein